MSESPSIIYPHWGPSEKAVLSIILQEPHQIDLVPSLSEEHFNLPAHKEIFQAIISVGELDPHDSLQQVVQYLHANGRLDKAGGPITVTECYSYTPSGKGIERHMKTLARYLARRKAIGAALNLLETAQESDDENELVEAAGGPITAIFDSLSQLKPPSDTKRGIDASYERYQGRISGTHSADGIPTTIPEIDHALRGLFAGRMGVIGAFPSGGKSVIGSQIAVGTSLNGHSTGYVPLEMTEGELIDRALIQTARVPAEAFTDPSKVEDRAGIDGNVSWARDALKAAPFHIRHPDNKTLAAVVATIRRLKREQGVKVVILDFIQQVRCRIKGATKEQEMEEISHTLAELSKELQIALLVMSQLSGEGNTKHGKVIEEDVDFFLQIVQEMDRSKKTFKDHQHILIVKDRHYGRGGWRLPLILDKTGIRFIRGTPDGPSTPKPSIDF